MINFQSARDGFSRGPAIPRQHDNFDSLFVQHLNRFVGRLLDRIGNRNEPGRSIVDCNKHYGVAFAAQFLGAFTERSGIDGQLIEKLDVAQRYGTFIHFADDSSAGSRAEILGIRELHSLFFGRRDNRRGKRMLAGALDAGRQA